MSKTNFENTLLWGDGVNNGNKLPKVIWMYWDPIVPSYLVEICISQVKSLNEDYKINVVTESSLSSFIQYIPTKRDDLPFACFADIVRLALLKDYGGIWLDASILLNKNLNWVNELQSLQKVDLISFYADFFTQDIEFPILENWFLATPKKSNFIKLWYEEYLLCYISAEPLLYYKDLPKEWLQGIDENLSKYLLCYLAAIKIMRSNNDFRILMLPSSETAHYYNFKIKLKPHQLAQEFLLNTIATCNFDLIKFEKRGRVEIDNYISKGLLSKKSLLYKIAPKPSSKFMGIKYKLKYYAYILANIMKKIF